MKWSTKLLIALCSSLLSVSALADSGGVTLSSNTSTLVIGPAGISPASSYTAWVTNTAYSQGAYIRANGGVYFALVAGTSTNIGTGPAGAGDITDKTVTWRACSSHRRVGLSVCNNSTNPASDVFISDQKPAAYGKGWRLAPLGGSLVLTDAACPQSELYMFMVIGGNANVSTATW